MRDRIDGWVEAAALCLLAPLVLLTIGAPPSRLAARVETGLFTAVLLAGALTAPVPPEWSLVTSAMWFAWFAASLAYTVLAGSALVRLVAAHYRQGAR